MFSIFIPYAPCRLVALLYRAVSGAFACRQPGGPQYSSISYLWTACKKSMKKPPERGSGGHPFKKACLGRVQERAIGGLFRRRRHGAFCANGASSRPARLCRCSGPPQTSPAVPAPGLSRPIQWDGARRQSCASSTDCGRSGAPPCRCRRRRRSSRRCRYRCPHGSPSCPRRS